MRCRLGAAPTAPRVGMASSLYPQSHAHCQPLRLSLPEARTTRMARQYTAKGAGGHTRAALNSPQAGLYPPLPGMRPSLGPEIRGSRSRRAQVS